MFELTKRKMFMSVLIPDYVCTFWDFDKNRYKVLQQIAVYRSLQSVSVHDDILLFGFEQGDSTLFIWGKDPMRRMRRRSPNEGKFFQGELLRL